MITLHNYPLQITPSNAPHWWSVSSNLSGTTNFKYVFDVWVNKNGWDKVARLKTRPNDVGYGHIDLREIMFNQLIPNLRTELYNFGNVNPSAQVIPSAIEGYTYSNVLNDDPNYNPLWHVSEYRVALGEEYTSGSTTILNIDSSVSGETGNTAYSAYTITIYPGAQDNTLSIPLEYQSTGYTGAYGQNAWKDWNVWNYHFNTSGYTTSNKRQFLISMGDDYSTEVINTTTPNDFSTTVQYVRHRMHHIDCPMIVPFFYSSNGEFCNDVKRVVPFYRVTGTTFNAALVSATNTPFSACSLTDVDSRIVHTVFQPNKYDFPPSNMPSAYLIAGFSDSPISTGNSVSEYIRFDIQKEDCLSDPIHIIFLNKRGVWDSYTFDRKSIRRLSKKDSTYAQAPNIGKSVFNMFQYEQREVIYDYEIVEQVDAQSWYMDENDQVIIEELFLSPYTYLWTKWDYDYNTATYSNSSTLVPIKIDSNTWTEFKNRYNKLYQYGFTFTYNPINQKLRQG